MKNNVKNKGGNTKFSGVKTAFKIFIALIGLFLIYAIVYYSINQYDNSSDKILLMDHRDSSAEFNISENNYEESMTQIVHPYLDSLEVSGTFKSGQHSIAYNLYLLDAPKANIVISHGFTERKEKYRETIYYFLKMGYQVFILDHYGHGASSRGVTDSSMVHIDDYNLFVEDFHKYISGPVQKHSRGVKTLLYGHSMGGAIGVLTAEQYPGIFDALILNTPMMKIKNPIPECVGEPIANAMVLSGNATKYALGNRAFVPESDKEYRPDNPATFCTTRGSYWHDYILTLTGHPSRGASWAAASEFIELTHTVVRNSNVEKLKIPILLFQAGKDGYVDPKGHYEFVNKAANVESYLVKNAGHEIYIESDEIIVPYFNMIYNFVEKVSK